MIVLDASAFLAYIFRENGYNQVEKHIGNACISSVNLCEVYGRFIRDGITVEPLILYLKQTSIEIVDFDQEQAQYAAEILPLTKTYGLSLGDRACLSLAKVRNLAALTADIAWTDINGLNVEVISIR